MLITSSHSHKINRMNLLFGWLSHRAYPARTSDLSYSMPEPSFLHTTKEHWHPPIMFMLVCYAMSHIPIVGRQSLAPAKYVSLLHKEVLVTLLNSIYITLVLVQECFGDVAVCHLCIVRH